MPSSPPHLRLLILGAGATGGYFGARLAQAGADVRFLVRPARAARLAADGLTLRSPLGDTHLADPPLVIADELGDGPGAAGPFDLAILSSKAYDLDSALDALSPAIGPDTAILPLLNGLAHLDRLDARFGAGRVLGGCCFIASTLAADGTIHHLNEIAGLTYGERDGRTSPRLARIDAALRGAPGFTAEASPEILQRMWDKWVFLATLAGATTLMRAAIGDIVAAEGGAAMIAALRDECAAIATAAGHPPRNADMLAQLTRPGSTLTASMLRDIEAGARIEADQIIGDLRDRGRRLLPGRPFPLLDQVRLGLASYDNRRIRTQTAG